uniref:Putative secreted protein n=1 Tax=Anopheles marajoara TaxID=58244 RepID=A0A2M4CCZ1_9DIPT
MGSTHGNQNYVLLLLPSLLAVKHHLSALYTTCTNQAHNITDLVGWSKFRKRCIRFKYLLSMISRTLVKDITANG